MMAVNELPTELPGGTTTVYEAPTELAGGTAYPLEDDEPGVRVATGIVPLYPGVEESGVKVTTGIVAL
jgi:hypothetical protein